jgi:Ca-activated chloride channel family protein
VLSNEDFTNDKKDAGEIGAGQTVTALYELVLKEDADMSKAVDKTFVTFDCRYKKSLDAESIPLQTTLKVEDIFNKNERSDNFYFAAGVAAYGMILRDSPYKGDVTIDMASRLVKNHLGTDSHGYRSELLKLMEKSRWELLSQQ